MKKSRKIKEKPQAAAKPGFPWRRWWPWLAGAAALIVVFQVYGPALRGAFVFDDRNAGFFAPGRNESATTWVGRIRPLLMLSFWIDYRFAHGNDPGQYHQTSVLLHFFTSVFAALIVAKLAEWAGAAEKMRSALALFAGSIFLLHPLQTESVAYVSERAEALSVMFYYAAFAVFLYKRGESITLARSLAIVLLFGAAIASKEHTLTLPALLLLTDYFWSRGGVRKNASLYGMFAVAGAAGAAMVLRVIGESKTAGFNLREMSPAAFFFTQCRVVWDYIRLFFLPFGQNIDHDVATSHTLLEHGAILGLLALIALVAAAWSYRKQFPLASYGIFVFLLLIAPTSSFVPLSDAIAERRAYLPLIGLLLVCCEFLRRLRFEQVVWTSVAAAVFCSVLTYKRAEVWSSPLALWQDSVAKSPEKYRPRFQLAYAQYELGRCADAAKNYELASHMAPVQPDLLVDWGLSLDCAGRWEEAITKLNQALQFKDTAHVHSQIAAVYARHQHVPEALRELAAAEKLDPSFDVTYLYRGNIYRMMGDRPAAVREYQHALALNPRNDPARIALEQIGR
ncbi:MAG TPA: tetratricopeptide repeat protein [Bryobacteraceae bacterium]|jgi:tetratricopeptide (TPR) repeat protein|nr:tetratricopeptide repeat protein [Bryobacteraceae bacterium]